MTQPGRAIGIGVGLFVTCLVDLFRPSVGFAAVKLLEAAGWFVCDFGAHDISRPCAIREFPLKKGHGAVDYLLYLQGKAVMHG